jgi:hypothetical protein
MRERWGDERNSLRVSFVPTDLYAKQKLKKLFHSFSWVHIPIFPREILVKKKF